MPLQLGPESILICAIYVLSCYKIVVPIYKGMCSLGLTHYSKEYETVSFNVRITWQVISICNMWGLRMLPLANTKVDINPQHIVKISNCLWGYNYCTPTNNCLLHRKPLVCSSQII